MFCTKCGKPLKEDAKFCMGCGQSVEITMAALAEIQAKKNVAEAKPEMKVEPEVKVAPVQRPEPEVKAVPVQRPEPAKKPKKEKGASGLNVLTIVLLVIMILIGICIIFILLKDREAGDEERLFSRETTESVEKESEEEQEKEKPSESQGESQAESQAQGPSESASASSAPAEKPSEEGNVGKEVDVKTVLEAYDNHILNVLNGERAWSGYSLIYLNDDDIPELVAHGNSEASGMKICYYVDGNLVETQLGRTGISYIKKGSLLLNSDGNMGYYYDVVYEMTDGKLLITNEGSWMEDHTDAQGNYDKWNGNYIYTWNGKTVSKEAYFSELEKVYPTENAIVMGYDEPCYATAHEAYEAGSGVVIVVPQEAPSQYILPTSNSEFLTMDDLKGLTKEECRIARNELYARYGRRFNDEALQAHFDSCEWYNGTIPAEEFDDTVLNEYEVANRDLIVQYEQEMGYR